MYRKIYSHANSIKVLMMMMTSPAVFPAIMDLHYLILVIINNK